MEKNFRHEYKFLISANAAKLLKLRLPHIMGRDPHAGPAGQYTIRSLYFDDPSFTAFREKVDGVDNRTKYRIRCYNGDTSICRLERKEKKGHLTRKSGQSITEADAAALQNLTFSGCPDHPTGLTAELRTLCASQGLRPMVLVDYDRTPFVCASGNTRITLDENLRTRPYQADLWASSHAMIPVLVNNEVVLEVKFDDFLPGYLRDALSDIPKIPLAISKFAMCMNLI